MFSSVVTIGAGGLGFESRVGQIGHSVANGSPPLQCFFRGVVALVLSRGNGSRYTLRRSNARMTKICYFLCFSKMTLTPSIHQKILPRLFTLLLICFPYSKSPQRIETPLANSGTLLWYRVDWDLLYSARWRKVIDAMLSTSL